MRVTCYIVHETEKAAGAVFSLSQEIPVHIPKKKIAKIEKLDAKTERWIGKLAVDGKINQRRAFPVALDVDDDYLTFLGIS